MKELNFEKAYLKLEELVEKLENGEHELEEMLNFYEQAVKLSGVCQNKLNKIENKIEILNEKINKPRGEDE